MDRVFVFWGRRLEIQRVNFTSWAFNRCRGGVPGWTLRAWRFVVDYYAPRPALREPQP